MIYLLCLAVKLVIYALLQETYRQIATRGELCFIIYIIYASYSFPF